MSLIGDLYDFFQPRVCGMCGRRLLSGERDLLCSTCQLAFPYARPPYAAGSPFERRFWGKLPVVRAAALFRYRGGSSSASPVLSLKYARRPDIGHALGRSLALRLQATDFFAGIDLIVPVPLSRQRQRRRSYNQSEQIAEGIGRVAGLPVCTDAVRRTVDNPSQTGIDAFSRADNVAGIFAVVRPEAIAGRHVLLVDDVATTGATLVSCGSELAQVDGVRISIAVLGDAGDLV